jgi:predicted alpha/beta-fold hydrolase
VIDGRPFAAPWWCRNRHVQTVWGPLFRRGRLPLRRERVPTPDGDFLDLDWTDGPPAAPRLLVLHGLEGSAQSHYVAGLLGEASTRGWRGVLLNFRSCSGELNRLPRFYHSGDTGDLGAVVRLLLERESEVPLAAAGVSIGGNVLLKWLGELGGAYPAVLVGAVAISVPFDLAQCARVLDRGFGRVVYTTSFLRSMRRKVREKAQRFPGFVDVDAAQRARTFAEYDRAVTAPLHGFADELDYWTRASSRPYLERIGCPTLLLHALDDPFVPRSALPDRAALPSRVRLEVTAQGGHVGFVEGRWPWRVSSWAERRALEFVSEALASSSRAAPPVCVG